MKLSIMADNLAPALAVAARAINKRATLPVLENVRLGTDDACLTIDATNLSLWLHVEVPAKVEESGDGPAAITVNAKDLLSIAKLAAREETRRVDISVEKLTPSSTVEKLLVTTADGKRTLPTIDADEYPVFQPTADRLTARFAAGDLRRALNEASAAVAADVARPILGGVSLRLSGRQAEFCGADNYRLVISTAEVFGGKYKGDERIILRGDFVEELIRLLPAGDETAVLIVDTARHNASVTLELATGRATSTVTLAGTLIDGHFPNYRGVTPQRTNRSSVTVPRQRFLDALKGAATVEAPAVRLDVNDDGLKISASANEKTFETTIAAGYAGIPQWAAFDPRYLSTVSAFDDESIVLWLDGPQSPLLIDAAGRSNVEVVVMPVRTVN